MKNTAILIWCLTLCGSVAVANDHPKPSPEQREKMAALHDKMSVCLRSTRPASDCHHEMMTSCKETMGKEGCPMMGHAGMNHGMKAEKDEKDARDTKIKNGVKKMREEEPDDEIVGKKSH